MGNSDKIILDLCGGTGSWSKPYKDAGYDVRVITLPDSDIRKYYINDEYLIFSGQNNSNDLWIPYKKIRGILAAPPCTEFSFAKSKSKIPRDMMKGMEIVKACLNIIWAVQYILPTPLAKRTYLKFWALENPFGLLRRYLGHPVLIFNPCDYGDRYQKKTCLWGYFNIPKKSSITLTPAEKRKFGTNSQNLPDIEFFNPLFNDDGYKLPAGYDKRAAKRAVTPPEFAKAFYEANK